jgi:hypothetical protein
MAKMTKRESDRRAENDITDMMMRAGRKAGRAGASVADAGAQAYQMARRLTGSSFWGALGEFEQSYWRACASLATGPTFTTNPEAFHAAVLAAMQGDARRG